MRKTIFANGEYYHIYNRGTDKREIFSSDEDYFKFLRCLREFNDASTFEQRMFLKNIAQSSMKVSKELSSCTQELSSLEKSSDQDLPKLVEIVAYCLNPNHFHLILKQLEEDGIKTFMHKIGTGYTNYFNSKNERSGSLFQGPFKAVHIDPNEYLLYLSAYVNGNHFIHVHENADSKRSLAPWEAWPYSSFPDYAGKRKGTLCNMEIILEQFSDVKNYEDFAREHMLQMREKKEFAKLLLDEK
jgi:putative transposase